MKLRARRPSGPVPEAMAARREPLPAAMTSPTIGPKPPIAPPDRRP
ncbi:hypothetical protein ALSL_0272 [Aerosticca soli]|uniref:Uncharacterized protein n=1 Tax=Aerosticca soli TaxID=2010829 RepID=A0A2Z6E2E9_9GAMM|nr:hypothetical protein ALSL_0272 [Aerosticca soli]